MYCVSKFQIIFFKVKVFLILTFLSEICNFLSTRLFQFILFYPLILTHDAADLSVAFVPISSEHYRVFIKAMRYINPRFTYLLT